MTDAFQTRLNVLRDRFRGRMASERVALQNIVSDLERGGPIDQSTEEVRRIAHGLAGAGGTFGFAGVSACAAALEEFVSAPEKAELAERCRTLVLELDCALGVPAPATLQSIHGAADRLSTA